METNEFLSFLMDHPNKELLFDYKDGQLVGANYHITEVKNITVDAVDCGAGTDFWKETVIQLWESPSELGKTNYMTTNKALSILKKVAAIKPMEESAAVKFEYGNAGFHTAQLYVRGVETTSRQVLVKLSEQPADCKAKETCGIPAEESVSETAACAPGSGCC